MTLLVSSLRPGLKLLSFDGGGIRGLSSVVILEEIMEQIFHAENALRADRGMMPLEHPPKPCEFFDLIGGTSTGGIIALMVGRLRMDVEDAIRCYVNLSATVFSEKKRGLGDGKFKARNLEKAIRNTVVTRTGDPDTLLKDDGALGGVCKTFVCTRNAHNINSPVVFKTYAGMDDAYSTCTIWEAARATSAAPTFFKRIHLGKYDEAFIDGGIGHNNPSGVLIHEAQKLFPDQPIECIVSIGTGQSGIIDLRPPNVFQRFFPLHIIPTLISISTDCESIHTEMERRYSKLPGTYFRFNVEHGLECMDMSHYEKLAEVGAHTRAYLGTDHARKQLKVLMNGPAPLEMVQECVLESPTGECQVGMRLKLLSIDGGGVRGLSSLLILERIMEQVMVAENRRREGAGVELLDKPPKPCEYFDLMGGSGSGGIIALMLGRLRMEIGEAISSYYTLVGDVFTTQMPWDDELFSSTNLKAIFRSIIQRFATNKDPDALLLDDGNPEEICETFICACDANNMDLPVLFRTYHLREHVPIECTIWEAALATSVLPPFFKRAEIGSLHQPFVGGGIGYNNPSSLVLDEARKIHGDAPVVCLVSIGAGQEGISIPRSLSFPLHAISVLSAMLSIVRESQQTHEEMMEQFATSPDTYFRFNVEHGLQSVERTNSDKIIQVGAHTRAYLNSDHVGKQLQALAVNPFLKGTERASATHSNQPAKARKLRLLSLDGGGVRGLSSLYILRRIMQDVMVAENKLHATSDNMELLTHPPKPCDYFDLIGGTEAGGIIALMLGRLRMDVESAIECYSNIVRNVFSTPRMWSTERFSTNNFDKMIQSLIHEVTGDPVTKLLDDGAPENICKTFVCVRNMHNMNSPVLFKTYPGTGRAYSACTIWQAARATFSLPTFFKPIEIGMYNEAFISGGIGHNNPAALVLEEAKTLFPRESAACMLSLGTGQRSVIGIPKPSYLNRLLPIDTIIAIALIASNCEKTHMVLERRFAHLPDTYFRFNVDQGLQNINSFDWSKLGDIVANTEAYLSKTDVELRVRRLVDITSNSISAQDEPVGGPAARDSDSLN